MKKPELIEYTNEQFNHSFDLKDWDIEHLFEDTIWAEFLDDINGEKITKGGLHIPQNSRSMKDFLRIARVLKVGPKCSEVIREGAYLLIPPSVGIPGIYDGPNGGPSIFVKEDRIMAVISPKSEEAVKDKEEKY